jgi:hypothetical protein
MNKAIALWAHPRAVSTAFLRMMIEREDVIVVHEPLVTLVDEGEVPITDGQGGTVVLRSPGEVIRHLKALTRFAPVFFKNTCEFQYEYLFEHPEEIADIEHTFIVREPARAINSHYHVKPTVTCPEIGYEHLYRIFDLAETIQGRAPVVVNAERMVRDPETVVREYCSRVGLPFIDKALRWRPEDRPEWQRTQKWHVEVSRSSGFAPDEKRYEVTVDNNATLRSYYDYHYPYYERLVRHAI